MKKFAVRVLAISLALAVLMTPSVPQPVTKALGAGTAAPSTQTTTDQLGRQTPSGTVVGFLQTAQEWNYKAAADYLQMSNVRRFSQDPGLAEKLKFLMDHAF